MAANAQVATVSGNLTFTSLDNEIESMPLSGSFTGSSDTGGNSGRSSAGSGGGGSSGSSQVQNPKKAKANPLPLKNPMPRNLAGIKEKRERKNNREAARLVRDEKFSRARSFMVAQVLRLCLKMIL
jgi:hypothetical protein